MIYVNDHHGRWDGDGPGLWPRHELASARRSSCRSRLLGDPFLFKVALLDLRPHAVGASVFGNSRSTDYC